MQSGLLAAREQRARKEIEAGLRALCEQHGVAFTAGPDGPSHHMTPERRLQALEAVRHNVAALCRRFDAPFEAPEKPAAGDTVFAKPEEVSPTPTAEGLAAVKAQADCVLAHITSKEGEPIRGNAIFVQPAPPSSDIVEVPAEDTGATGDVFEADGEAKEAETDAEPGPGEQLDPGDPPAEPIKTAPAEDTRPTPDALKKPAGKKGPRKKK